MNAKPSRVYGTAKIVLYSAALILVVLNHWNFSFPCLNPNAVSALGPPGSVGRLPVLRLCTGKSPYHLVVTFDATPAKQQEDYLIDLLILAVFVPTYLFVRRKETGRALPEEKERSKESNLD